MDRSDFLALLGLGLISYGAWLIYPPASFIVSGSVILAAATVLARR